MNNNDETLRPYGPGKFDLVLDAFIYTESLDGCDEEAGSVDEHGWRGLIKGPFTIENDVDLTPFERQYLAKQAGCILGEDSQGFVYVAYYETNEALQAEWNEIEQWNATLNNA